MYWLIQPKIILLNSPKKWAERSGGLKPLLSVAGFFFPRFLFAFPIIGFLSLISSLDPSTKKSRHFFIKYPTFFCTIILQEDETMFGCQQVLIKSDKETQSILEYLCSESAKLSNCGIYYSRQLYFKTGRIPYRAELYKVLGTENHNLHYRAFYSDTAQQILTG